MNTRNDFLETLKFDVPTAIDEYSKYMYDYKEDFYRQAYREHIAISKIFPELDFHTVCRIKSFKSTLDKARHKGLDKVYDIHGIRHIINSVYGKNDEDILIKYCYKIRDYLKSYYASSSIHTEINREKDYILSPKENGYQALHLSGVAMNGHNRRFETQIKTTKMDEFAKYGNANHAEKYKPRALGKNPLSNVPRYAVIRSIDGKPAMHELSLEDCFQYFYNVPYADCLANRELDEKN